MEMQTRTAMILAAGLGTRLKPLTDNMPKALVPYHGVPMLGRLAVKLKSAGFMRIIINVHHFADMVEEYMASNGNFGMQVIFSDERDLLRDTGGAIRHAAEYIRGPVLIHNVDIISDLDLGQFYDKSLECSRKHPDIAAVLCVSDRKSSRYFLTVRDGHLKGWIYPEKNIMKGIGKDCAVRSSEPKDMELIRCAFSGIHTIFPETIGLMAGMPEKFSVTDFYLNIADRHPVLCIQAPEGTEIADMGKLSALSADLNGPLG